MLRSRPVSSWVRHFRFPLTTSTTVANLLPAPSTSKMDPQQPPHLELRIPTNSVSLYPESSEITTDADAHSALMARPPKPTSPPTLTYLLIGSLDDFLIFSRQEQSQWLIDIAHDICDPAQKRGSLRVWDEARQVWRDVNPTDPLTASIYLYDVWTAVSITKISKRTGKFKTSFTGTGSTMADRVLRRDGELCWVTRRKYAISNSHVCPKRMGDHQLRVIYNHFVTGPPCPPDLSIHDEICGITLGKICDSFFDLYELGLRHLGPDQYECHVFRRDPLEEYVHVFEPVRNPPASVCLHGLRISPPRPQHKDNPPPGLIRWHYLQCVVRKFVHSDYKNMKNIHYYELPQQMEGDSDDEGTDSELDWLSALFDHGRAMRNEVRQRSVAEWAITVL